MRRLFLAAALSAGLGLATTVAGADSTFTFELVFDNGPLSGNTYPGSLTVDPTAGIPDPGDPDTRLFTPNDGLLAFAVNVAGIPFSDLDDDGFPDFPEIVVAVTSSSFISVDYLSIDDPNEYGLSIYFDTLAPLNVVSFDPPVNSTEDSSSGIFRQTFLQPIPDGGSTVALIGLSMAGLGWFSRRRQTSS